MSKQEQRKRKLTDLISQPSETPQQRIVEQVQVKKTHSEEEVSFTFFLTKTKMRFLKLRSIESEKSLKKLINEGIDLILK